MVLRGVPGKKVGTSPEVADERGVPGNFAQPSATGPAQARGAGEVPANFGEFGSQGATRSGRVGGRAAARLPGGASGAAAAGSVRGWLFLPARRHVNSNS